MHLSSRVLHFWACRCTRKSESGISDDEPTNDFEFSTDLRGWDPSWKPDQDARTLWYRTVEEYTRLHISYPSDTLPALAALTQRMHKLRPDDMFLAGLWNNTLLFDLLWKAPSRPKFRRLAKWRAPTWSWASVEVPVNWDLRLDSVLETVKLLQVCCDTKGPPEMGNISMEATITLRAPLVKATWARQWTRSRWLQITGEVNAIDADRYCPDYDYDLTGPYNIPWESEFHLVPIAIISFPLSYDNDAKNHRRISLALQAKVGTPFYERIGYVEIAEKRPQVNQSPQEAQASFESVNAVLRSLPRVDITTI
ncbi:uncharacterized protein Z518_01327 [Rhinocladiella mackenziei CBS 650.93]|uniref:Heterokaryon incompatibility domain-containing protein n=1 Tax=Rhinocladiella mackenziei CBS 650.93 TaxID=1442369 RepID=A0A0D2J3F3_9EURO|nr:uncharacterized protein Z518_01327 [Rhinocladiella mackenziei CBS 650.93]KIX10246.1 hypothetical protein Z518_01327 [Rhinocladiella mackenziei CBS 650.93]